MERIIYDELFSRTYHLIDSRQNGFLKNNSCAMNMTTLIESLSTNLLQDLPTDIIYFDFAKAFDTVNHDLILSKLKYQYSIDGRMLKFFKSYLFNRTQRVVLDNCTSDIVDVLSGVPQGSILGTLLFVLFINDIFNSIDKNLLIGLYADDTKLSRKIETWSDCDILQSDIDTLNNWCISNKMKFNTDKCKVLTVGKSEPMITNELPFCKYSYTLGDKILDYTSCERDLGILINERLDWHEHHDYVLKKGYQMLEMTKRTCHFVFDSGKKRMLYLTLVRSNFEHCSTIWRPVNIVDLRKFEALQKRAIKWINSEEAYRYSDEVYTIRCREANILPLQLHFELNDLVFFYKIVYDLIPVSLPAYISPYNGESRLRSTRMDELSYAVNDNTVIPLDTAHSNSKFFKSFFYRTMHSWNALPLDIRKSCPLVKFKLEVKNFLWNKLLSNNSLEMG